MEKVISHKISPRPSVSVFAEPGGFSISLVESLLSNFCCVNIYAENIEGWRHLSFHLCENRYLKIFHFNQGLAPSEYCFFISGVYSKIEAKTFNEFLIQEIQRVSWFKRLIDPSSKKIIIFPLLSEGVLCELTTNYDSSFSSYSKDGLVVYLGTLFGPRMILHQRDMLSLFFRQYLAHDKHTPTLAGCGFIYPTPIAESAKEVVKLALSGNYFGKKVRVSGKEVTKSDFETWARAYATSLERPTEDGFKNSVDYLLGVYDEERVLSGLTPSKVKETISWFEGSKDPFYFESFSINNPKVGNGVRISKLTTKGYPDLFKSVRLVAKTFKAYAKKMIAKLNHSPRITKAQQPEKAPSVTVIKSVKPPRPSKPLPKFVVFLVSLLLTFFIIPFFTLLISTSLIYFGLKEAEKGDFAKSSYVFNLSSATSNVSKSQFYFYSGLSPLDKIFKGPLKYSEVVNELSLAGVTSCDIAQVATQAFSKIMSGEKFDVKASSEILALDLENLYRQTSFLQSEMGEISFLGIKKLQLAFKDFDFAKKREEIVAAKTLVASLGQLIGDQGKKNYLLLFQNNMEIRPTGGFIGSFAIVKFDDGNLTGIDVFDVYSADGQLKGHVEPPWQIRQYLAQATWYLRDSNWDPDFSVSAQRAEWFLDKEMDIAVDGVVGVDLFVVKDLVGILGPIQLSEFNQEITASNFYEVTQYQAEKDFFAGSRKKANFLSALTDKLMGQVKSIDKNNFYQLISSVYKNASERHIQLFLNNSDLQKEILKLGWDGAVDQTTCVKDNCFYDWYGVVEANLGVNKANYFAERSSKLSVDLEKGKVMHTLTLNMSSSANKALEDNGTYKTYLRVISPGGSIFDSVKIETSGEEESLDPFVEYVQGRVEAGIYVEIRPGQEKHLVFTWGTPSEISYNTNGEYKLSVRKQAGIANFPQSGEIHFPSGVNVGSDTIGVLTEGSVVKYNTQLVRDFAAHLFW